MKKIVSITLAIFLSISMIYSFDIEEVAGFEEYDINFGLRNFVADPYAAFKIELSLPIMEQIKLGFITGIDLKMDTYTLEENKNGGEQGRNEIQKWSKINTNFDAFIGLPVTDEINLTILAAGGSVISKYESTKDTIHNYYNDTMSGFGYGKIGAGIIIKSAIFNDFINDMKIRQFLRIAGGNGISSDVTSFNTLLGTLGISDSIVEKIDGAEFATKNEYVAVNYDGLVGISKGFEIGLPKFELGFEVDYSVRSINYTKINTIIEASQYAQNPSGIGGGAGLKINLALNPMSHLENNFWIKPSFSIDSINYTYTGRSSQSTGIIGTTIATGANWKATFAKIVWLKFDAEWRFTFNQVYRADENVGEWKWNTLAGNVTLTHFLDPGLTLGFNFEGWNAEFKWAPRFAVASSSDSNILNLANWKLEVSTKFPALYKKPVVVAPVVEPAPVTPAPKAKPKAK